MQSFIARGSADKYTNRAVDRLLVPVGKEAFSPTQSQTPIALPGRLMLRTSFALFCSRSYPTVLACLQASPQRQRHPHFYPPEQLSSKKAPAILALFQPSAHTKFAGLTRLAGHPQEPTLRR